MTWKAFVCMKLQSGLNTAQIPWKARIDVFSQIENMQWLPSAEIKAWLMKYPKLTCRNLENKHLIIPQHTAHPELWQWTFFLGELARGRNFPLLSFLKTVVWISEFNEKSKLGKGWEELTQEASRDLSGLLISQTRTWPVFHRIFFF